MVSGEGRKWATQSIPDTFIRYEVVNSSMQ
ncbi:Protein of unknown function [Bacillus cytotoxicus]|uniref:Uncharacterized protein n=1 Tax=Bacillus cytotoxicus TaxID=580165 RepID=A0AAX2CGG1_9BACI|nr:Protein of unknown function [Bacillus cytotoxicus]SCN35983.1 Protein of unknown function [Bacillus cytotoxicus]